MLNQLLFLLDSLLLQCHHHGRLTARLLLDIAVVSSLVNQFGALVVFSGLSVE